MRRLGTLAFAGALCVAVCQSTAAGPAAAVECAQATASVADATAYEGGSAAPGHLLFTVSATAAPGCGATGSVTYTTLGSGPDYLPVAGTLTWTGDPGLRTVVVTTIGDNVPEPDETFEMVLSAPAGLTIGDPTATGTIADDDTSPPEMSVEGGKICWRGESSCPVGVRLRQPARGMLTVHWRTIAVGQGSPGYVPVRDAVLTFSAGAVEARAVVTLLQGQLPDEQLKVELFYPSTGVITGPAGTVRITSS